jgi:hypothetical protein
MRNKELAEKHASQYGTGSIESCFGKIGASLQEAEVGCTAIGTAIGMAKN